MGRVIYKHRIPRNAAIELITEVPKGAKFLSAGFQPDEPTLCVFWLLVDDEAPKETRKFVAIGTGWDVPSNLTYLGTAQAPSEPLVWHIFTEAVYDDPI